MRLATPEEIAVAGETLSDVVQNLHQFRVRLDGRIEASQRRLSRSSGTQSIILTEGIEQLQELNARATFLTAWALYYQSFLRGRADNARVAEELFAELLGLQTAHDRPEHASVDRCNLESYARSILGMALCKSMTSPISTALGWVRLLGHESTFEALRDQLPAWEIVILLEHGEYVDVRRQLDELAAGRPTLPLSWLRVVAVQALEAADADRHAAELARVAVTRLAAQKELSQVLDLAARYGTTALGESGFALRYVSGVLQYHEARDAHGDEQPTIDPALTALYQKASGDFTAAMEEPDAGEYPAAAADARRLLAWCLYFRGEFLAARDAFGVAEAEASADDAPDLLWMAIVSLDKVVRAGKNRVLAAELDRLITRFLEQYPHSMHAPKLVLRRSLDAGEATEEIVNQLLAVPPGSEVADAARRQAAQMLYRLFRDRSGSERIQFANRYLDVAVPLFARQTDLLAAADDLERARFLTRGRRILEVALLEEVHRLVAAANVFDAFDRAVEDRLVDLEPVADEIAYRRMRVRLYEGDMIAADVLAEQLWEASDDSVWPGLAARAMFRYGVERWREAGPDADVRAARDLVIRYGTRVLDEHVAEPDALATIPVMNTAATIAEASFEAWEQGRDERLGRLSLGLYERLLAVQPRNAAFLRAAALLSESLGSSEFALGCWRTLLTGSAEYSERWYEAKVHQISLLAATDRARAREVMDQHKRLNPEFGPAPWGEQLRALDAELTGPGSGKRGSQ